MDRPSSEHRARSGGRRWQRPVSHHVRTPPPHQVRMARRSGCRKRCMRFTGGGTTRRQAATAGAASRACTRDIERSTTPTVDGFGSRLDRAPHPTRAGGSISTATHTVATSSKPVERRTTSGSEGWFDRTVKASLGAPKRCIILYLFRGALTRLTVVGSACGALLGFSCVLGRHLTGQRRCVRRASHGCIRRLGWCRRHRSWCLSCVTAVTGLR